MYCKYCGKIIDDDSKFCSECGNSISIENKAGHLSDKSSKGFAILGFFIPIIGLILYLVYEHKQPKRAKSAGKGALIGFITKIVVYIVIVILYIIFASSILEDAVDNTHINTRNINSIEETADLDVEFGKFKVVNNGYTCDTSLEVTITNKCGKQKSFFITIEAIDEEGTRLDTDMIIADRLNPGQKIRLEAFEYVPIENIEQYKTATFKVLEVQKY
jgi:predicted nucleic acid-binding Zn ribbon protein